jgi:predicted transcriptional regulator of viral defense system
MIYTALSGREARLLDKVEGMIVFTDFDAKKLLGIQADAARRALSRLAKKGAIVRLERGKYVTAGTYDEWDVRELATRVVEPSYVSFLSGLHLRGMSAQVPSETWLACTVSRRPFELQGRRVRCVRLRRRMFFGYETVGRAVVGEPEKLIADCLAFPAYSGGETAAALRAARLSVKKLVDYAIRGGSAAACSRLGYLLERSGKDFDREMLHRHSSKSYVWLDPASKGGERIRAWHLFAGGGGLAD